MNLPRLNHIFPLDYPNPPTEEDLNFEVQDLMRHSESPFDIINYINDISCPYHRKAIATLVPPTWHSMEQDGKAPAIFEDMDGYRRITWLNIDSDIRRIIKKANTEQVELEQKQPPITLNTKHSTLNPKSMPLIIQKQEGNITNNQYENCVFYCGTTPQDMPVQTTSIVKPTEEITEVIESQPNLDKFRSLLTVPYRNRKRECEAMLDLLTQDGWNKKDRARMALALYKSGNVALQREHITTFRQWWRICCELLGWEGADASYKESQLTPNQATKNIELYL